MKILFDYTLRKTRDGQNNSDHLTQDVVQNLCCGDVIIADENADISARFGWIPLIDFMLVVSGILSTIDVNDCEYYEFTESTDVIIFKHEGIRIRIIPSYSDEVVVADIDTLKESLRKMAISLFSDAEKQYIGIQKNGEYIKAKESILDNLG